MGSKKYTGPERRVGYTTRRKPGEERRIADRIAGTSPSDDVTGPFLGSRLNQDRVGITPGLSIDPIGEPHRRNFGPSIMTQSIISTHKTEGRPERRHGAGRRKGDLARAVKSGEQVVFDLAKMKSPKMALAKKALGKAGKLGNLALGAITLYDMVNSNKQ